MVVGNWKMHGERAAFAELAAIERAAALARGVDVILCPPSTLLTAAAAVARHAIIGAQDCHPAPAGAHTGCISAPMLAEAGASWVILGHSEAHPRGQRDCVRLVEQVRSARRAGLGVILCVGESADRPGVDGDAVADQLAASLPPDIGDAPLAIAYEPAWAIGSGQTPRPCEIGAVLDRLRGLAEARLGRGVFGVRFLYGGSVQAGTLPTILSVESVDGCLVGGASLREATFAPILRALTERCRARRVAES